MALILVYLLVPLLYLAISRWMLLDAVRRGRGWIRWQVLLNDQDRLIVNKRVYLAGDPAIGDIVMLRYPRDPRKSCG